MLIDGTIGTGGGSTTVDADENSDGPYRAATERGRTTTTNPGSTVASGPSLTVSRRESLQMHMGVGRSWPKRLTVD